MMAFIRQSPFYLLATASREGRCDVSPRGDQPGFVGILDPHTLILPERSGNRRADSLKNIIDSGWAGLLFLIPGLTETLRVNGRAQVIRDEAILAPLTIQGKQPLVAIALTVEECFLQCGRALLRSHLWEQPDAAAPAELPSFADMLMDQAKLETMSRQDVEERIRTGYKNLY